MIVCFWPHRGTNKQNPKMAYNRHLEKQCKNTAPFLESDDLDDPGRALELAAL